MTLPEPQPRIRIPSSIRLLATPEIRPHSLIFAILTGAFFSTAYAGQALGSSQAWAVLFSLGAATGGTYLTYAFLTLFERTSWLVLHPPIGIRVILLGLIFGPIFGVADYSIWQAGTPQAIPAYSAFQATFYAWLLLQSYFIATPASQLLTKFEKYLKTEGVSKKTAKYLGIAFLLLPIPPLAYSIWAISAWLSTTYQYIPDANTRILSWATLLGIILVVSYIFTLRWGSRAIHRGTPEAAIFAGGLYLAGWGYLMYRASMAGMGYVTQNPSTNSVFDIGLILVSIVGAVQTFSGKTLKKADHRWSQILPFLIFAAGAVYATVQLYTTFQIAATNLITSIAMNMVVFAAGILTTMFLIRQRMSAGGVLQQPVQTENSNDLMTDMGSKKSTSTILSKIRRRKETVSNKNGDRERPGDEGDALENEVQEFLDQNLGRPNSSEERTLDTDDTSSSDQDGSEPDY